MLTLKDFLGLLPGIKPMKTRQLVLEGDLLNEGQRRDIRDRNSSVIDLVVVVGPDAAAAIVAAYKAGKLPMKTAARGHPRHQELTRTWLTLRSIGIKLQNENG